MNDVACFAVPVHHVDTCAHVLYMCMWVVELRLPVNLWDESICISKKLLLEYLLETRFQNRFFLLPSVAMACGQLPWSQMLCMVHNMPRDWRISYCNSTPFDSAFQNVVDLSILDAAWLQH